MKENGDFGDKISLVIVVFIFFVFLHINFNAIALCFGKDVSGEICNKIFIGE